MTLDAEKLLTALRAEAAEAPVIPSHGLGLAAFKRARTRLALLGYIERVSGGWRLTPRGCTWSASRESRTGGTE